METGCSSVPDRLYQKKKVTLLVVGLDDAGKTSLLRMITGRTPAKQRQRALAGISKAEMDPSGVSGVEMPVAGYQVTLLDLPGDPGLRILWRVYYPRCHGLVFVVDSANGFRLWESRKVFRETLTHRHVVGKPVLLLLNKQDHRRASRQNVLEEKLLVEKTGQQSECPCIVVKSSAMPDCHKSLGMKAIQCGLRHLLHQVSPEYQVLCRRVEDDTERIRVMEEETRRGSERLVKIEEEPEGKEDDDLPEKSIHGSSEKSQVVDSLSGKSDVHLLASSNPWNDPAMHRDLSISLQEQLDALMTAYDRMLLLPIQGGESSFSDTVLIEHQGNHGGALCQSSTLQQEEEVRALCQSSTVQQEEEVRALCQSSTVQQGEEVRALCQSSTVQQGEEVRALCQSSTVQQGEEVRALCQSSTVQQGEDVSALCEKEKKKWKNKFSKHFGFKKYRKTKDGQLEIAQTSSHKDFIPVSPNTVSPPASQPDTGSQLQEESVKRSVLTKAFSSFRKGLCNIFKRKNRILPCTI